MQSIQSEYDALTKENSREVAREIKDLNKQLGEAGCHFDKAPIPCFLKPYFLSDKEEKRFGPIMTGIVDMLEQAVRTYFRYPELQPIFGVRKEERKYIEADPGYSKNIIISRPDAFIGQGTCHFIELNCDSPAGPGYTDVQEAIFKKSIVMQKLGKRYRWKKPRRLALLLKALVGCYREFGGRRSHPTIAIVDWREVRTLPEFELIRDYFIAQGYPCVIADPRELRLRGGKLYAEGIRLDLIYRRVITHELMAKKEECRDFLRAYCLNKVCVVNPLRSRLAGNKAVLSIITNPAYDFLFSAKEIAIRDKYIPWTRRVLDAKKFYGGKRVYLTQMIEENRRDLVLKPAQGYGGKDVYIGRETGLAKWRMTIQRALRGGENWVVQEYVPVPVMTVPLMKNGRVYLQKKKVNINPYAFAGQYAGAVARLSDSSVINVSNGGGLIPSISYAKRV